MLLYIESVRITVLCGNIGACMHHIQCNWYTSVWDACGLCYFAQVLPAVLLYCCGLAFLGLVAWSQFCGYRSAARLMKSRITRIRLLFSKQFDSETSFRSNLRSSWLLGGPNWLSLLWIFTSLWTFCGEQKARAIGCNFKTNNFIMFSKRKPASSQITCEWICPCLVILAVSSKRL